VAMLYHRSFGQTAMSISCDICQKLYVAAVCALSAAHVITSIAQVRAETLMCYLGIGDTYTPCHKDLCASSGHNLMCYTENSASAFWFMTRTCSATAVAEYFRSLGHELDWEVHATSITQLADAPFDVFITEQKLGDFILVPPRSCHQVVNHGGLSIKSSWSRLTVKGAAMALRYELPIYRRFFILPFLWIPVALTISPYLLVCVVQKSTASNPPYIRHSCITLWSSRRSYRKTRTNQGLSSYFIVSAFLGIYA
jgi:JmjC domain, hydroxylase